MDFPRHLHKPDGLFVICENQEQCDQLSVRGWALLPDAHVEKPVQVSVFDALVESAPEADLPDDVAPPKRGRKK